MNTTHLFVELLVIGFGAFLALTLLALAVFGYPPSLEAEMGDVDLNVILLAGLLPLLSFVYVLGILVDRFADRLFDRWDKGHRERVFGNDRMRYFNYRRTLVIDAAPLWEQLEYGRSRLRICRGWVLNSIFLLIALLVLYGFQRPPLMDCWRLIVSCIALTVVGTASFWAWWELNSSEYRKIERLAEWVEIRASEKNKEKVDAEQSGEE